MTKINTPSKFVAPTGRVTTWLNNPELGTLPVSCTISEPSFITPEDRFKFIEYVYLALSRGAGINVHLHNFVPYGDLEGLSNSIPLVPYTGNSLELYLNPSHSDFDSEVFFPSLKPTPEEIVVGDSLDDIFACVWKTLEYALEGEICQVNLSLLRPNGTKNSKGMIASGAKSFAFIFKRAYELGKDWSISNLLSFLSSINQEVRKGGIYKNGAITTSYPAHLSYWQEYVNTHKDLHPWLKKGLVLCGDHKDYLQDSDYSLIFSKVNDGTLWLEKSVGQGKDGLMFWLYSDDYNASYALRHNVCREILIRHGETCNITPVNLGMIESPEDLVPAYMETYEFLKSVHQANAVKDLSIYKSADEDKQIGVSLVGLANLLANFDVSYKLFAFVFASVLDDPKVKSLILGAPKDLTTRMPNWFTLRVDIWVKARQEVNSTEESYEECFNLVRNLIEAHIQVARQANVDNYKRVFTIAPGASVAFRYKDSLGYSLSPAIYPPFDTEEVRESQTNDVIHAFYPDNVEIASKVSYSDIFTIANCFQTLFNLTGKAHAISLDIYPTFNQKWFDLWCASELTSTYYKQRVDEGLNVLDKSDPLMCSACAS